MLLTLQNVNLRSTLPGEIFIGSIQWKAGEISVMEIFGSMAAVIRTPLAPATPFSSQQQASFGCIWIAILYMCAFGGHYCIGRYSFDVAQCNEPHHLEHRSSLIGAIQPIGDQQFQRARKNSIFMSGIWMRMCLQHTSFGANSSWTRMLSDGEMRCIGIRWW